MGIKFEKLINQLPHVKIVSIKYYFPSLKYVYSLKCVAIIIPYAVALYFIYQNT